ncbi:tRNA (N6-threonylcarbamoyladenosine(37)-N6)-methyltransferase TrmO [Vibrio hippocampi]|uniref:S-adenosyl-L-methionine-binding protein n=1 Tax=Vibrio hippocampi TaxID=654686 RepID=A0ABM8ZLK8_9VIBR|nr:tRNA (N6-threonylcarbamoyladenosine(37)-N6)-methyltransferase TrmO [Vibrio hippocampi]CAH0529297.1 S-adenosyl-L-methionine-binding protein [Vibrio hippocampi]
MTATLNFIGKISTPYTSVEACPNNIQAQGPTCRITLFEEFKPGLSGLAVGDNILVLYWLADAQRDQVVQVSRGGDRKGTFALRSPHRPNPIGAAVLPITAIDNGVISVRGLDCLDNTPLIDIKPAIYRENVN